MLNFIFFFNDTATTEIYTLSLHDALPILHQSNGQHFSSAGVMHQHAGNFRDRKSTRLNSSHTVISYAVFCLKKKKKESFVFHHLEFSTKMTLYNCSSQ